MARATVIADASFCPMTRAGGWAVWINVNWANGNHRRIQQSGVFHTRAVNSTEAERWAAYNGIWIAYKVGARDILIQTDCLSVVVGEHSATFKKMWPDARIKWKHVKGHNLHNVQDRRTWVNNWCDKHAKRRMRAQRREML